MNQNVLDHAKVLSLLPDRKINAHKGDFGRILLLCGSRGYTGAAALAALGALRCGAGLVYLGVPESIYAIEAIKLTEPIVFPLPDSEGMLSEGAADHVLKMLSKMDSVLIGPGLGQSEGTLAVLKTVLKNADCPVVVDADGINLLSGHKDILRGRTAPTIMTPHMGEFIRLGGNTNAARADAAVEIATALGTVLVLKGHGTIVTDGEECYVNPTGNPGMAVGGSGDVLAGMIAGLLGQGLTPLTAAACGVWLHGAAGDVCAKNTGMYGMLPSDMLAEIPRLMK